MDDWLGRLDIGWWKSGSWRIGRKTGWMWSVAIVSKRGSQPPLTPQIEECSISPQKISAKSADIWFLDHYQLNTWPKLSLWLPSRPERKSQANRSENKYHLPQNYFWVPQQGKNMLQCHLKSSIKDCLFCKLPSMLDSIAVSIFVVVLVDFEKYRIWDEQPCLLCEAQAWCHHGAQILERVTLTFKAGCPCTLNIPNQIYKYKYKYKNKHKQKHKYKY